MTETPSGESQPHTAPPDTASQPHTAPPGTASQPHTAPQAPPTGAPHRRPQRTRFSAMWTAVIIAGIVLVLLLIFILQNLRSVKISFLGANGHLPLAIAMLVSAVAGGLLVAIPGVGRMVQLRRTLRRHGR